LGAGISDTNFKTIILNSLPHSWDPAVTALYRNQSSTEVISQLQVWWLWVSYDCITNLIQSIMALHTSTSRYKDKDQLICNNPNCNHCNYTIDVCHWPSGGKKRQFPPGFGKRGGAKESTTNTQQNGFREAPSTNITTTTNINEQQAFTLITIGDTHLELPLSFSQNPTPNITLVRITNSRLKFILFFFSFSFPFLFQFIFYFEKLRLGFSIT